MPQSGETAPLKKTISSTRSRIPSVFFLAFLLHFVSAGVKGVATEPGTEKEGAMLWTIAVILLVLWALGMVSSYTAGGLVHLLLVIAIVVVVLQFIGGRRSA